MRELANIEIKEISIKDCTAEFGGGMVIIITDEGTELIIGCMTIFNCNST
jgi:hypothetical protein